MFMLHINTYNQKTIKTILCKQVNFPKFYTRFQQISFYYLIFNTIFVYYWEDQGPTYIKESLKIPIKMKINNSTCIYIGMFSYFQYYYNYYTSRRIVCICTRTCLKSISPFKILIRPIWLRYKRYFNSTRGHGTLYKSIDGQKLSSFKMI